MWEAESNLFYSNTHQKSLQTTSASPCLIYGLAFVSLICSFKVMLWATCGQLSSLLSDFHWVLLHFFRSSLSPTSKQCFEVTSSVLSVALNLYFEKLLPSCLVCSLIFHWLAIDFKIIKTHNTGVEKLATMRFIMERLTGLFLESSFYSTSLLGWNRNPN